MGMKIEQIFKVVEEKAGNNGRLKFAQTTKIAKSKALQIKDDPELITYLKNVATQIIGQDIDPFLS